MMSLNEIKCQAAFTDTFEKPTKKKENALKGPQIL
jgi:hypothetical protein